MSSSQEQEWLAQGSDFPGMVQLGSGWEVSNYKADFMEQVQITESDITQENFNQAVGEVVDLYQRDEISESAFKVLIHGLVASYTQQYIQQEIGNSLQESFMGNLNPARILKSLYASQENG